MIDPTDFQAVSRAVLEAISLRMGYPVDSMEIDFSIDHDLGMDSVKQLEIVNDLQALFPGTRKPGVEKFQSLRDMVLWCFTGQPEDIPPPKPYRPPEPPGGGVPPVGWYSTMPPEVEFVAEKGWEADAAEGPATDRLPPHPETLSSYRGVDTTRIPSPRPPA